MIPAAQSAAFVCQMEQVLDLYEQPYDADYPVVCLDESPKQLIEQQLFIAANGQRYHDSEYVRRGVAELFVATEPLRGWRALSVEDDHRAATWVRFVARLMDTTYRDAKKVRWVMDNLGTHKVSFFYDHFPPDVARAYLQRMEIIYPPPSTARGSIWPKSNSPSSAVRPSTASLPTKPPCKQPSNAGKTSKIPN